MSRHALPWLMVVVAAIVSLLFFGARPAASVALGAATLLAIGAGRQWLVERRGWPPPQAAIPLYLLMALVFVGAIQWFGLLPVPIAIGVMVGMIAQLANVLLTTRTGKAKEASAPSSEGD
ncbi:hypothetical protein OAS86_00155 [Gammaproteobacteria bacterium]|nr:hypothetical protein [Gammaproteobacteria bacterium]